MKKCLNCFNKNIHIHYKDFCSDYCFKSYFFNLPYKTSKVFNMIKYLSFCSGVGMFEKGLLETKIPFKMVGFSEIDKQCINVYKNNFNCKNYGDITLIDPRSLPNFDLMTAGFPCQSFSNIGLQKGDKDKRGKIIYYLLDIIKIKKPKYIILENVKGFTQYKFKGIFLHIQKKLREYGYLINWNILNSMDYITPQNRKRLFIICYRKDLIKEFKEFKFPIQLRKLSLNKMTTLNNLDIPKHLDLKDILDKNKDENKIFYANEKLLKDLEYKKYNNYITLKISTKKGFIKGYKYDGISLNFSSKNSNSRDRIQNKVRFNFINTK